MRTMLAVLTFVVSSTAVAQMPERVFPTSFLWQLQPGDVANDERFAAMQARHVHVAAYYYDAIPPYTVLPPTPVNAAILLTDLIKRNYAAGQVTGDNVCVLLPGFGHDLHQSQPEWVDPPGNDPSLPQGAPFLPDLGFFTPGVDSLPGVSAGDFPQPPTPFPMNFPMQVGNNQWLDARPWRHPFLLNATTQNSPLRRWMTTFVNKIDEIYDANPSLMPDPANWRWRFDSEPFAFWVGGQNGTYIPSVLAAGHADPNSIWNKWKVPGSPGWTPPNDSELRTPGTTQGFASAGGQTLATMYASAAAKYGLPPNPELAFNIGVRADEPVNRPGMLWWMNTWHHAADAVMNNAAYSVIVGKWPTARTGNWDMSSVDAEVDTTPWYIDWNQTPPGTYPYAVTDQLKRSVIDPSPAKHAPPLTRHAGPTGTYQLWVGIEQHSSGTEDCPFFYPLNDAQLNGVAGDRPFGHRQQDVYIPGGGTLEDDMTTTLRLNRHTAESIINSHGGQRHEKLVPWMPEYVGDVTQLPSDPLPYFAYEPEQIALLAMLRGKNTGEFLFWPSTVGQTAQDAAWKQTADVVKRVYMGTIDQVKIIHGELAAGSPEHEPSMLEYTLRDAAGEEYTADLTMETSSVLGTVAQVTLVGYDVIPTPPAFSCGATSSLAQLDIFVEGWVTNTTGGEVTIKNVVTENWDVLRTYIPATPDGRFRLRMQTPSCVNAEERYIDDEGTIVLRLHHHADPTNTLLSKYDLVQVVPFWPCPCNGPEDGIESMSAADATCDGTVDAQDVIEFADGWIAGAPVSDINLDGQVDLADIDEFDAAFINANP